MGPCVAKNFNVQSGMCFWAGATVELRGRDSGNLESLHGEGGQEPLHLFLSSNSLKNLDDAKLLAENLLDTICAECGAFRVSSRKAYGAVPPLQQLLNGVHSSVNEIKANAFSAAGSISSAVGIYPQATPLQQVALALRQSPSPVTSAVSPANPAANMVTGLGVSSSSETERRPPHKRKFQESPVASKDPSKLHQKLPPALMARCSIHAGMNGE
ncbi:hypothetical protein RJ641_006688, partial [Dillenia turbinata]